MNVALLGSTGMVGSQILTTLLSSPSVSHVSTISRRPPSTSTSPNPSKLTTHISTDLTTWPSTLSSLTPPPQILISSLATTRGNAGSFSAQYALEHDLNIELAKAARERTTTPPSQSPTSPTETFILISSASATPSSRIPYTRMKGEIESSILSLGYPHTIIIRPGLISGRREETRILEGVVRGVADVLGGISGGWLKDGWAQDADVIGRCAVRAGMLVQSGRSKELGVSEGRPKELGESRGEGKVWVLSGKDIIRLGRTEWKDE